MWGYRGWQYDWEKCKRRWKAIFREFKQIPWECDFCEWPRQVCICQWLLEVKTQNETEMRRRDNNEVNATASWFSPSLISQQPKPSFCHRCDPYRPPKASLRKEIGSLRQRNGVLELQVQVWSRTRNTNIFLQCKIDSFFYKGNFFNLNWRVHLYSTPIK